MWIKILQINSTISFLTEFVGSFVGLNYLFTLVLLEKETIDDYQVLVKKILKCEIYRDLILNTNLKL